LDHAKARDLKVFESLGGFDDKNKSTGDSNTQEVTTGEGEHELMSGDMKRELLRQKWEQQEEQLQNKTDIHYQDVLFDGKYMVFLSLAVWDCTTQTLTEIGRELCLDQLLAEHSKMVLIKK
jgi:hypothetical protein